MFNSTILDLALGLVFIFLTLSLAVSATVESIASIRELALADSSSGDEGSLE